MSHEHDAERGRLAQMVLDNPEYLAANAAVEAEIHRLWAESRDPADREQLHQMLLMLGKVRGALESTMRSGKVAEHELKRERTRAERMLSAVR